jgi:hypothetical protein
VWKAPGLFSTHPPPQASATVVGNWDEEAIQALSRATRAGVTRGELVGEPQSSSSSLEATSDGSAELSEGGEGGCATNFWSLEGVLSPLSR